MTTTQTVTITKHAARACYNWSESANTYTAHDAQGNEVGEWRANGGVPFGRVGAIGTAYSEPMTLWEWKAAVRAQS